MGRCSCIIQEGPLLIRRQECQSEKNKWWKQRSEERDIWRVYAAGLEDAGREPLAKDCEKLLEAGEGKETELPLDPLERKVALSTSWF